MSTSQFYHKQPGNHSNRRERVKVIDVAARREQQTNPDRAAVHHIRKYIKLFSILIVSMGALLVLSIKYVEYQWGRRDRRIISSYESAHGEAPAMLSTNNVPVTPIEVPPGTEPSVPSARVGTSPAMAEVETIFRWGKILEEAGELEGALDRYGEALKIDPENLAVLSQAGRLNIRLNRYDEAVAVLSNARKLAIHNPDILNDLGVALTFNGQMKEAVELYDELMDEHPDYVPALFNQGYALMQLQEYEKAMPLLEEYIGHKPDDPMALGVLAVLELNDQHHETALQLLDQAIKLSPEWAMPYLDAATICATLEENDRALSYLEKALKITQPAEVYQRYQTSAFNEIRLTDSGKVFEKMIAEEARQVLKQ